MPIWRVGGGSGGGGGSSDSFVTFQVPNGTDPVATSPTDVMTFTSSDNSVTITGDATTDTIDFVAVGGGGIPPLTDAHIFVGNALNVATDVAMSGDITISNTGVTAIGSGVIVNADVNASAAIAYSKLNLSASIVNADIASGAAIAVNKLAALGATRIALTDASGFLTNTNSGVTLSAAGALDLSSAGTVSFGSAAARISYPSGVLNMVAGATGNVPSITATGNTLTLGSTSASSNTTVTIGNTTGLATFIQTLTSSSGSANTNSMDLYAGPVSGTSTGQAGATTIWGGWTASSNSTSQANDVTIRGGRITNASHTGNARHAIIEGGPTAGNGLGGNAIIQGGTSASGTAGYVQIGRTGTTAKNVLNNLTQATGAVALTLLNGPTGTTGNPSVWVRFTFNGSDIVIPGWAI